jgi:hypothetical protein
MCITKQNTNEPTNYVTAWSTFMLEKLAVPQPVKEFPAFYGTRRFITALLLFLSYAR